MGLYAQGSPNGNRQPPLLLLRSASQNNTYLILGQFGLSFLYPAIYELNSENIPIEETFLVV